eukprot:EG_transcript_7989
MSSEVPFKVLSLIQAFSDDMPLPQFAVGARPERVVFDRLDGAQREGERYANHTSGIAIGQCTLGWSFGVFRIAIRLLTPCALRRLGLSQRYGVGPRGESLGAPTPEDIPIRILPPLGIFKVGSMEFHFDDNLPAGSECRLKVDLDNMTAQLHVNDWDSGVIGVDPQSVPSPLYPYFVLDSGDAIEVVPY